MRKRIVMEAVIAPIFLVAMMDGTYVEPDRGEYYRYEKGKQKAVISRPVHNNYESSINRPVISKSEKKLIIKGYYEKK